MKENIIRARNKTNSKQQFLNAVGRILQNKGHEGLKVNDIAQVAGLDKKLIYKYFGGLDGLLDEYLHTQDFWSNVNTDLEPDKVKDHGKAIGLQLLQNQFDYVFQNKEFQKVLLWGLAEERESLKKLTDDQEENGEALFSNITDPHFGDKATDFRAVMAILISGIYYLNLYSEVNGSVFCGLDLKEEKSRATIKNALKFLVDATYDKL